MRTSPYMLLLLLLLITLCCRHGTDSTPPEPTPTISTSPTPQIDVGGGLASPEPGDAAPEEFEGTAGIVEKPRRHAELAILREVRTGRHSTFDRVVFEFEGKSTPGYRLEYVDKPVRDCGAGNVVSVTGDGFLKVEIVPAHAHTDDGEPTIKGRERAPDLPVLKELKLICDFEAHIEWILGLSSPNRYRVLELSNPPRLVVDIRHR